jgi:cytidine deaminase
MKLLNDEEKNNLQEAIKIAKSVRVNAHSPYSNYKVGVALKAKSGKFYSGCNVENHGIESICAERVAFTKALSEGEKEFEYIVAIGGNSLDIADEICLPCGYCRQFMSEFVNKDFKIYAVYGDKVEEYTITELLPYGFKI